MPGLDVSGIVNEMTDAAIVAVGEDWPKLKLFAESEFRKLGETAVMIQKAWLTTEIDEEEARLLMDMQKHALRSVLLTIEGLGILIVEEAINAAIDAVRGTVNTAIGFALL